MYIYVDDYIDARLDLMDPDKENEDPIHPSPISEPEVISQTIQRKIIPKIRRVRNKESLLSERRPGEKDYFEGAKLNLLPAISLSESEPRNKYTTNQLDLKHLNPSCVLFEDENCFTQNPSPVLDQNKKKSAPKSPPVHAHDNCSASNPAPVLGQDKNYYAPNPSPVLGQNKNNSDPNPSSVLVQDKNYYAPNPSPVLVQDKHYDAPNPSPVLGQDINDSAPKPYPVHVWDKNCSAPNPSPVLVDKNYPAPNIKESIVSAIPLRNLATKQRKVDGPEIRQNGILHFIHIKSHLNIPFY